MNTYKKIIVSGALMSALSFGTFAFAETGPSPLPPVKAPKLESNDNDGVREMHAVDGVKDNNNGGEKEGMSDTVKAKQFKRAQDNFEKEAARIDARRADLEKKLESLAAKKDTSVAKTALQDAITKLDAAKAAEKSATDKASVEKARKMMKDAKKSMDQVLKKVKKMPKPKQEGGDKTPLPPIPAPTTNTGAVTQ